MLYNLDAVVLATYPWISTPYNMNSTSNIEQDESSSWYLHYNEENIIKIYPELNHKILNQIES